MTTAKPAIFILIGPSGVGKTVIGHALMRRFKRLRRMVTYTTREPRPDERDGVDYYFVKPAAFARKVAAGDFIEHATVHGDSYGSSWAELRRLQEQGISVLFIIDIQGAKLLKKKIRDAVTIFVQADSFGALRTRLQRRRSNEAPEQIERRLQTARAEMGQKRWAAHVVTNRQGARARAVDEIAKIMKRAWV